MSTITISSVDKTYPDGTKAVRGLSLEVAKGEFVVFVGPSGCGKTTALRMVAGLEDITAGEITIGGARVNDVEPQQRDVAMVFQNYALYPHMSVFDNIAFPLACRKVPKPEIRRRVSETAELLDLTPHLRRGPRHLSGGQRQRVAMGRAIVRQPQAFLMDEPLSNLDAKLRTHMRAEVARLQRELGVTTIYVTHDQVEAMTMGHRIAVMRHGVLQQFGPAQLLYEQPDNLFVATFVGSPPMNLMQGRVVDAAQLSVGDQRIATDRALPAGMASVAVGIRPEHLREPSGAPGETLLRGTVVLTEMLGADQLVHLRVAADPVLTDDVLVAARDLDPTVVADLEADRRHHSVTVIARFDPGTGVELGTTQEVAVRVDRLHLFDLITGKRL
jgi:multiple sugar transport system ATP-binding protein